MTTFSKRLQKLRKETTLSARLFAEDIGIPEKRYASYEQAKAEPDMETLVRIADLLRIDVRELITGEKTTESQKEMMVKIANDRYRMATAIAIIKNAVKNL